MYSSPTASRHTTNDLVDLILASRNRWHMAPLIKRLREDFVDA